MGFQPEIPDMSPPSTPGVSIPQYAPAPKSSAAPQPSGVDRAGLMKYLKHRGYSDELAPRLADNVMANPTYPGNADHMQNARTYLAGQMSPTQVMQATMQVMTTDGLKTMPSSVADYLVKNGMATEQTDARTQPGYYMAQALPMAQAMAQKWGIAPDQAANITTKLLAPMKNDEQNPIVGQVTPSQPMGGPGSSMGPKGI